MPLVGAPTTDAAVRLDVESLRVFRELVAAEGFTAAADRRSHTTPVATEDPLIEFQQKVEKLGYALRMRYLARGDGGSIPDVFNAWLVDREFNNPERRALEVRVLLTRDQLSDLKNVMLELSDPTKTPDKQYGVLLNVYKNEINRGRALGAYEGPHPDDPNQTVDYINFGRVAFVYMSKDEKEIKRFDLESRTWEPVDAGLNLEMRNAIRMALGETGDSLARIPVKVTN